jgi:hypothetical protein
MADCCKRTMISGLVAVGLLHSGLAAADDAASKSPAADEAPPRTRRAHGFTTEAGFGAIALQKPTSTLAIGPVATVGVGYDVFHWLTVGAVLSLSTQRSTLPPPPEHEYQQMYRAGALARIGGQVGPVLLSVEGGAGIGRLSSNLLERASLIKPGQRNSVALFGGAAIEYQLGNRHYALGLGANGWYFTQFQSAITVEGRLFLHYTY